MARTDYSTRQSILQVSGEKILESQLARLRLCCPACEPPGLPRVSAAVIYPHVLNSGGRGVRSQLDQLGNAPVSLSRPS